MIPVSAFHVWLSGVLLAFQQLLCQKISAPQNCRSDDAALIRGRRSFKFILYSWHFVVGGVPPSSPNRDLISHRKIVIFHTRFQTCRRQKLCHHYLQWIKLQRKRFLKIHFHAHFTLSFLFIWNWSNKSVHAVSHSLENHTQNQT